MIHFWWRCFRVSHVPAEAITEGSMSEHLDGLTHVFRCLQSGSRPGLSAAAVAGVVCGLVASPCEDSVDVTCISVSLVDMMTCLVHQRQPGPAAELTLYCVDTLTLMLRDMELMTRLVHLFQSEDQIVSHLAAKCASSCVVYQLLKSGTVSPIWQQKCVQTFLSSPSSAELDACLWSLTDVLKRLLKTAHQEILWKLVAPFDSSLSALCSKFLPEDRQLLVDSSSSRRWGTTFCLLLELLEALTASSFICVAGLKSQRLAYMHSPALLAAVSCSPEYFVKKRALLLLKRLILQKAGEDWAPEDVLSSRQRHEHFGSDMNVLARTVLTAVAADWLQSVQVGSVSYFGGTRVIRGGEGQKPDCVMLRGVSLLLLKSMELRIQTAGRTAEQDCATEVSGCLQSLWGFLRRSSVQLADVTHHCCWVSLLFGEQDDDMMEAANALLCIFLHHRCNSSGVDDSAELEAACSSGCNPHCHFLLLLQSVSFDHSTLLDFLISSETCFLEYLVRYLKYLRADWQGFTAACERDAEWRRHVSLQESLTCPGGGDKPAPTFKVESEHVESSAYVQPTCVVPPVEGVCLLSGLRLVEYDSSDQSDPESMEMSEDGPGASVKQERGRPPPSSVEKQHESCNSMGSLSEPTSTWEMSAEGLSPPRLPSRQGSLTQLGQGASETLASVVACLSELREVVTRLQTKKLFPYNPSSLLKLLAGVEICFQQSPQLLFTK